MTGGIAFEGHPIHGKSCMGQRIEDVAAVSRTVEPAVCKEGTHAWCTAHCVSQLFGSGAHRLFAVPVADDAGGAEGEAAEEKQKPLWLEIVLLVIGAAAIAVGARLLVDNGTLIAQALGVPDSVIGLTMVALGTSLPELITAITSLAKGHGALSLGNVIGANLFNIILVSGAAITISPFAVPAEKTIAGMNSSLIIDLPVMLGVMGILCIPTLLKGRLQRWQGILLLAVYAAFTVYQFVS